MVVQNQAQGGLITMGGFKTVLAIPAPRSKAGKIDKLP